MSHNIPLQWSNISIKTISFFFVSGSQLYIIDTDENGVIVNDPNIL